MMNEDICDNISTQNENYLGSDLQHSKSTYLDGHKSPVNNLPFLMKIIEELIRGVSVITHILCFV